MPRLTSRVYRVSPGYFDAAGTAMLSGRDFTWHDDKNAPRVAVINQEFARKLFGSVEKRNRQVFQVAGWDARTGGGRCARWKISDDQRRSTAGDVLLDPAIAIGWDDASGALEPRSAPTGGNHARANCGTWTQDCPLSSKPGIRDWA